VLKDSKDSARRRAVWEASKAVGGVLEPDLRELVKLRNESAVQLGFKNFHALQLYLNEQDGGELLQLFDELDELTREPHLALLCGRYEGFDDRVHEHLADDEVSIGRYVLAGGELPAMVLTDAIARRLPGALGNEESGLVESFSAELDGGVEYPHYTRPAEFRGWRVPDVLLSGDHRRIEEWRKEQSRLRTRS